MISGELSLIVSYMLENWDTEIFDKGFKACNIICCFFFARRGEWLEMPLAYCAECRGFEFRFCQPGNYGQLYCLLYFKHI